MTNLTAVFDMDYIKYAVASAGETRSIKAYHPIDGTEWKAKSRTELWGHYLKKDKGLLAEHNKTNGTNYTADELVVIDIQEPEPIANVKHSAKSMFESVLYQLKTNKYKGFIGKGESWRVGRSTILEYKGNRKDVLKPLLLDEISDYLTRKYNCEVVEGLECDDRVVMESFNKPDHCVIGIDKDYAGSPVNWFNPNKPEYAVVNCNKLGELFLDDKGKVRGFGRMFLYHQILSGDSSDNYAANSASKLDWGEKSSYKLLKDCKTDKAAFEALKKGYQLIYPEPVQIKGWRGVMLEVDWKYVFDENWTMAKMLRWEGDVTVGTTVMQKLGVNIDG